MKRQTRTRFSTVVLGLLSIAIAVGFVLFVIQLTQRSLVFTGISEGLKQSAQSGNTRPLGKVLAGYGIIVLSAMGLIELIIYVVESFTAGICQELLFRRFSKILSYEVLCFPVSIMIFHIANPGQPILPLEWFLGIGGLVGTVVSRLADRQKDLA